MCQALPQAPVHGARIQLVHASAQLLHVCLASLRACANTRAPTTSRSDQGPPLTARARRQRAAPRHGRHATARLSAKRRGGQSPQAPKTRLRGGVVEPVVLHRQAHEPQHLPLARHAGDVDAVLLQARQDAPLAGRQLPAQPAGSAGKGHDGMTRHAPRCSLPHSLQGTHIGATRHAFATRTAACLAVDALAGGGPLRDTLEQHAAACSSQGPQAGREAENADGPHR